MSGTPPRLTFTMELRVQVDPPLDLGQLPAGRRRIIAIRDGERHPDLVVVRVWKVE